MYITIYCSTILQQVKKPNAHEVHQGDTDSVSCKILALAPHMEDYVRHLVASAVSCDSAAWQDIAASGSNQAGGRAHDGHTNL